ncbi:MAG: hypothetical protein SO054_02385, partial [Ruminococcus callidus]|nr:hypothetical protein [Ruminococcus callidus]
NKNTRETLSGHDVQRAFFDFFACGTVGRGFLKIQGNTAQRASGDFARNLTTHLTHKLYAVFP